MTNGTPDIGTLEATQATLKKAADWRPSAVIVALICLTVVSYSPIRFNDFIAYDDGQYITENPDVQRGLTASSIVWAITSGYAANWHPLTWISHIIDVELYGKNALGHHLTNLLLHILNSVLLFIVLRRMTGAMWPSAIAAAVFALHPLHVESVAWAAERKDVLSTLFWILTMWAYVRYVEQPGTKRYVVMAALFALGLMSKPMLVTLPFVLLLLDYWPLNRFSFAQGEGSGKGRGRRGGNWFVRRKTVLRLVREKLPLFALVIASSAITFLVQREGGAVGSWQVLPLWVRVGNAFLSYFRYIWKTIWPTDLAIFYPHPGRSIPVWEIAVAVVVLIALTVFLTKFARRHRYVAVGWLWYVGTLVPVIGILQVGQQSMADRYMYVPMIGLSIIAAWGIPEALASWRYRRQALAIVTAVVIPIMCALTYAQVGTWRNSETVFQHALNVTSDNWLAHNNLGYEFLAQGKTDLAVQHIAEGLRINPINAEAHNNMAVHYAKIGDVANATFHYNEALRISPRFVDAHNNYGVFLAEQGKVNEAIEQYRAALAINPNNVDAHNNLGLTLAKERRFDEAAAQFTEALRLDPGNAVARGNLELSQSNKKADQETIDTYLSALQRNPNDAEAHSKLGEVYGAQKRIDEAMRHFAEAVRLNPNHATARLNLGLALLQTGKPADAIAHLTRAVELDPKNASAWYNLAMAYVALGRYTEAANYLVRAIQVKSDYGEAYNNLGIIYAQQGQEHQALTQFSEAVKYNPNDPDARYNLGFVLERQGRTAEAIEHYEAAVKLKPDHTNARKGLDRLKGKPQS
jgi:Tfp pilus assembly protein PilF